VSLEAAHCVDILAYLFPRSGFQQWLAVDRAGLYIVLMFFWDGAKVMRPASMSLKIHFPISLRLPDQTATMNVDVTVR
jgi:hypothetical protein